MLNIIGERYGRLKVIADGGYDAKGLRQWLCECECGTVKPIPSNGMRSGRIRSCGCLKREAGRRAGLLNVTHGMAGTPEYTAYLHARERCTKPNTHQYEDYGGRGIEFRFSSFEEFIADVGRKPEPKLTIDRINNDGHYEKGNVRWGTREQQMRNSRQAVMLTALGRTQCIRDWSREIGISETTIRLRKRRGMCDLCVLTAPRRGYCPH